MEYDGSLHFVRSGDSRYSVTFTSQQQKPGESPEFKRTFGSEAELGRFLLDAGFEAQRADGIQGGLHETSHLSVDDYKISDKELRRLFPQAAATAGR